MMGFRSDMLVVPLQLQSDAAALATTAVTTSTTFVDVGNGSTTGFVAWTFTMPRDTNCYLRVDLSCYMTNAAGQVYFQVLMDGSAPTQPTAGATFFFNQLSTHARMSWGFFLTVPAGSRTFKLQWKVQSGTQQAVVDSNDWRSFTLIG
jgi:hypothetical protein